MTIAELKGKLSPDRPNGASERMEDLLTSDVFGAMKYAGFENGFLDWILQAQQPQLSSEQKPIIDFFADRQVRTVRYSFWPKLPNGREPDVALLISFHSGSPILIVVEAKYFSGTSDMDGEEPDESCAITGNQLADQVVALEKMTSAEIAEWFHFESHSNDSFDLQNTVKIHLFITMHSTLPSSDYQKSMGKIRTSWPVPSYWLSWNSLAGSLKPYIQGTNDGFDALLQDLRLLLKRKGLIPFQGFQSTCWQGYKGTPSFFNNSFWNFKPTASKKYRSFLGDYQE